MIHIGRTKPTLLLDFDDGKIYTFPYDKPVYNFERTGLNFCDVVLSIVIILSTLSIYFNVIIMWNLSPK